MTQKKLDNKKMKNYFNYNLKFPTYVEGLNYILETILSNSKLFFLRPFCLISYDHHF